MDGAFLTLLVVYIFFYPSIKSLTTHFSLPPFSLIFFFCFYRGWNYVGCLESVIWGFQEQLKLEPKSQCGSMTALCRDIFRTEGVDSFAHGPAVRLAGNGTRSTAIIVALCAGIFASLLGLYTLRGGLHTLRGTSDVEFSRVSNEEALTI